MTAHLNTSSKWEEDAAEGPKIPSVGWLSHNISTMVHNGGLTGVICWSLTSGPLFQETHR